jgi:PIN like domain
VKFFFDNTMPRKVVEALKILDSSHKIVHLTEGFPADTPDANWISALSDEGDWVIISGDVRITRNPGERAAWLESKLLAFFLAKGWTNQSLWDQAWRFVKWWPSIVEQSSRIKPPAGFIVPLKSSKLEQVRI